jgi:hypothetical protein
MAQGKMAAAKAGKLDLAAIAAIVGGLVNVAQMVGERIPKKEAVAHGVSLPELAETVTGLEANWAQQAPLVQQLGEQFANVAAEVERLNQAVTLLRGLLVGTVAVSIVAVIVALLR